MCTKITEVNLSIMQFLCILESQSGRVFDGELLYTQILEVNLFAFAYRLFHKDFSPLNGASCKKLIYLYLFTEFVMTISLQSSETYG